MKFNLKDKYDMYEIVFQWVMTLTIQKMKEMCLSNCVRIHNWNLTIKHYGVQDFKIG